MRGLLYLFLSTATCSHVHRREANYVPETLPNLILESAFRLNHTDTGTADDLLELSIQLSDLTTGKITPVQTVSDGLAALSEIQIATPLQRAIAIVSAGLVPSNILSLLDPNNPLNSHTNNNAAPNSPIYPKSRFDAPYDIEESKLLSALYIPEGFTCTQKPILLVAGTGQPAGVVFSYNYGKLFPNSSAWVNIPGFALSDIQVNAEYVAYAMNYLHAKCNRPIGVLGWSQGPLDVQWALKYWPSTREGVSDFLAVSGDFDGTRLESVCLLVDEICTPAMLQQGYGSEFVRALQSQDGDSAYVSTTSVWSGLFDYVILPQNGKSASARLEDVRGIGVANVEVQVPCEGKAAGGYVSHSSLLLNPMTYALIVDALGHDGPGMVERVGAGVCDELLAPGLGIGDLLATEALGNLYGIMLDLLYYKGVRGGREPVLKDYVLRG